MLNKLLKILNLSNNQYFTEYNLSNNFLTIETSQVFEDETIIEEIGKIKEKINKSVYDCAYDNNVFSVSVKTIFKQITQEAYKELKK